jgi:hypothetical protein
MEERVPVSFDYHLVTFKREFDKDEFELYDDIKKVWYDKNGEPISLEKAYPREYVQSAVFMKKRYIAEDYGWFDEEETNREKQG